MSDAFDQGSMSAEDEQQLNGEIMWKAPVLSLTALGLVVGVPVCVAVVVIGYSGMADLLPPGTLRTLIGLAVAFGAVIGLLEGLGKRGLIVRTMAIDPGPMVPSTWSLVVTRYRPKTGTVVGLTVVVVYLVLTGRWGFLVFLAALRVGSLVASAAPWIFQVERWQRATGRQILIARHRGGERGYAATLPADELEAIVGGDLGDHDREWLLQLVASLHHGARFTEAAALGDHLYARWREPSDAYNTSCSLARAGDHALAVEYLGEALRGGFGRKEMVTDPDLRSLLPRPDVIELFKATAATPAHAESADVGAPPGDCLGDGIVHRGAFETEGRGDGA